MTARPSIRIVIGLLFAIMGSIWVLQGFDLLGQDGGMNGRGEWVVIGAVTAVLGLALAVAGFRERSRS